MKDAGFTRFESASADSNGFTIVETVVAVAVAGIFLTAIYGVSHVVNLLAISTAQSFTADSLSYANMRIYADGRAPSWFTCPSPETTAVTLISNSSAVTDLPTPVTQTVVADAAYGCAGASAGLPIRVTSTVTYGPNNLTAKNVTYASY